MMTNRESKMLLISQLFREVKGVVAVLFNAYFGA